MSPETLYTLRTTLRMGANQFFKRVYIVLVPYGVNTDFVSEFSEALFPLVAGGVEYF